MQSYSKILKGLRLKKNVYYQVKARKLGPEESDPALPEDQVGPGGEEGLEGVPPEEGTGQDPGEGLAGDREETGEEAGEGEEEEEEEEEEGESEEEFRERLRQEEEESRQQARQRAEEILKEAEKKGADLLESARRQGDEILSQARKTASEEARQVQEEARQEGYGEGIKSGKEEGERIRQQGEDFLDRVKKLRQETVDKLEPEVVELSVKIAEMLLYQQLSLEPETIAGVAAAAVKELRDQDYILVRVNPGDAGPLKGKREELTRLLKDRAVLEILPDEEISRGDCRVESDHGIVEVVLEEGLRQVRETLVGVLEAGKPAGVKEGPPAPAPGEGTGAGEETPGGRDGLNPGAG